MQTLFYFPSFPNYVKVKKSEILRLFIKYGANLNFIDEEGNNLLMILMNDIYIDSQSDTDDYNEYVSILLKHIDINAINYEGQTALQVFCASKSKFFRDTECIKILVEKGANIHIRDRFGNTLLHLLTRYHHIPSPRIYGQTAEYLIELGVDPEARNDESMTFWNYAMNISRLLRSHVYEERERIRERLIEVYKKVLFTKQQQHKETLNEISNNFEFLPPELVDFVTDILKLSDEDIDKLARDIFYNWQDYSMNDPFSFHNLRIS